MKPFGSCEKISRNITIYNVCPKRVIVFTRYQVLFNRFLAPLVLKNVFINNWKTLINIKIANNVFNKTVPTLECK